MHLVGRKEMTETKMYTRDEIIEIANSMVGKTFGELNDNRIDSNLYDHKFLYHID